MVLTPGVETCESENDRDVSACEYNESSAASANFRAVRLII